MILPNIFNKIKVFYEENRSEVLLGLLIFLLVTASFGIGWILGASVFERPPIVVNCPETLYQKQQ